MSLDAGPAYACVSETSLFGVGIADPHAVWTKPRPPKVASVTSSSAPERNPVPTPDPRHVAIIMDGNGRWAKARGRPRAFGHRAGVDAARRAVRAAVDLGLEALTLYGFSSENWKRPVAEIDDLMGLLRHFIRTDLAELARENIRIRIIGERGGLAPDLVKLIEEAESSTLANSGLLLVIAFNYGGRDEILRAVRRIAAAVAARTLSPEAVTGQLFAQHLDTAGLPDPDLVIRTSGEERLSNFLIYQAAYAEFVVLETLWPDFSKGDLAAAIAQYRARERRFGGIEPQSA